MAVKTSWTAGDVLTAADLTDTFAAKAALSGATFTGAVNLKGGVEVVSATPVIDFKTADAEDYDCRIAQESDGLTLYVGGNGATFAGLKVSSGGTTTLAANAKIETNGGTFRSASIAGSTTASAANMYISSTAGSEYISRSTSSIKYKTDVEDATAAEQDAVINGLRPITYKSLCENDDANARWWGFIAEEVEQIDPRLVHHGDDGEPEGVQYDRIIPALVGYIQRLEARLAVLEAK